MEIREAVPDDLPVVESIIYEAIKKKYPQYYPKGAVDFFLLHHCRENIASDLSHDLIYIMSEGVSVIGTVTIKDNEIGRLFVLPEHHRKGYGSALLDFAEARISVVYSSVRLDSSLPAKELYIKRGYSDSEYYTVETGNGDYLCYDIMVKNIVKKDFIGKINFDGRMFYAFENSANGEVDDRTVFHYHQQGRNVWAEYSGGDVVKGFLIGFADENSNLSFTYQHINRNGEIRIGKCKSIPELMESGLLKIYETWQWLNGDNSEGRSVLMEIQIL